jgi:erythrocyte band 7 integral membrane protein
MDPTDYSSTGKAPAVDDGVKASGSTVNGGFRPTHTPGRNDNPIVTVQPPKREDLQPSYAQILVGDEGQGQSHGWYGSMSKSGLVTGHIA